MHATSPAQCILLGLFSLIVFGEAYKLCCCSLCSLLHSPATSSHLGPQNPVFKHPHSMLIL
jgi:hypothetical protein